MTEKAETKENEAEGTEGVQRCVMREYSQGICQDGAAILCDGQPITIKQILERLRDLELAKLEAEQLAIHLWKKYYQEEAPQWGLCDSVAGVLTQIDNMTTGLIKEPSA